MSGNATEEWLMTRLDHPGHMDAGRFAGLSSGVVGIITGLTARSFLSGAVSAVIGLGFALVAGITVYRWINRRTLEREVFEMTERRKAQNAEAEAQITRMNADKASGDQKDDATTGRDKTMKEEL